MVGMARFAVIALRRLCPQGLKLRPTLAAWILAIATGFAAHVAAQPETPTIATLDEAGTQSEADEANQIVSRFEAELEMQRLMQEERYAEATEFGPTLVHLTEEEFGLKSTAAADAYVELADAERLAGEYEKAETGYLHALDLYREADGQFSARLIDPLVSLGDNYQESGEYTKALSAYDDARNVSRRVYGLLNEGQVEILDRLTKSYESLDQLPEAQEQQLAALTLVQRSYPPSSPEVLDAIYKYALWLRESHRYNEERDQYFRADRIIRDAYGDMSVYLVKPLRERANSFRIQGVASSQGSGGLDDALEILQAQADPDPRMLAELLRDRGDWQIAFSRFGGDGSEYLQSWQLLGELPDGDALREEWYSGIEFVLRAPLSRTGLTDDPEAPNGHVLVRFDITPIGRTENVSVIASEPPGLKDDAVSRQVRQSRFRPNIEDGQIITATNRALDFQFRYLTGEAPTAEQ